MGQGSIVFYVSGHGLGHARRSAALVAELVRRRPGLRVHVRTSAPAWVFAGHADVTVSVPPVAVDSGLVEHDTLSINAAASLEQVAEVLRRRDQVIKTESAVLREQRAELVLSDVPFLAGDIAAAAGVRCVGVSNFTWDWIYEPLMRHDPRWPGMLERISAGYARMERLLKLPFGQVCPAIERVQRLPLLAQRPRLSARQTLERLPEIPRDDRPRVLLALRGGIAEHSAIRGAAGAPGIEFLTLGPVNGGPQNLVHVDLRQGVDFSDLLGACDVAISKLGYGTVSECIATGKALLWPRRSGFREDGLAETEAARVMRMREIPIHDFAEGRWAEHLEALLASPPPPEQMPADGAEVIAEQVLQML